MPLIIRTLGGALRKALGTSRAESLSATANIFVGQTEAPLVVKPYIPYMTKSELFAIMVGGLSSIAGSVLAAYAGMGVKLEYLLAASFMAAPGGLLFAKILVPETESPEERLPEPDEDDEEEPVNVLDAAAQGASAGLKLALNVGAMLLAFIALIALLNLALGTVGGWFGSPDLTLQAILGNVFAPLAWLLGVPWAEAAQSGSFIGQKIILNEFVAYDAFLKSEGLSELSAGIVTFALCGFANLSSIAILLGGLGGIAPTRRKEIARFGLKAVFAASLANFMSAAIAGLFLMLSPPVSDPDLVPDHDDGNQPSKNHMIEILLALAVGVVVGLVFSACKLPLPSPPVLAGVVGIVGIYLGGELWKVVAEKFFS